MSRRAPVVVVATLTAIALAAGSAGAGTWMQSSCESPDGTAASSEGWTGSSSGGPGYGSSNSANCGPGSPMFGELSSQAPAPVGASENLQYVPPAGSTLIGGSVNVDLRADGGGYNGSGTAVLYEPQFVYPDDVFFQCAWGLAACSPSGHDFSGSISLPTNRGGDLYVVAGCGGAAGYQCNSGGSDNTWSEVRVNSAQLLLSNSAVPQAANITGTALGQGVRGTAHLLMTASDPGGPGIYLAAVALDGRPVYSGTPNANGGTCVSHGTGPGGAQMFGFAQPCPAVEQLALPVPTAGFSDAKHELTVTLVDAAGNSAPVLDRFITTSNPQTTPAPTGRHRVHMRFKIKWRFAGRHTRALKIWTERAPRRGRVTVRCVGRRCPRLKVKSGAPRHLERVIGSLLAGRFTAGQKLLINVAAPHLRTERIEIRIRNGKMPSARLLKR